MPCAEKSEDVSDSNKLCLLTGYPGFLGSRLYQQLKKSYDIHTIGLGLAETPKHLSFDLSQAVPKIMNTKYDIVIHAAGRAHMIPSSATEEALFFRVNQQGTVNLLAALDRLEHPPDAIVLISSVAVYGREHGICISESDSLDASDPYGLSKRKAEETVLSWNQPMTKKGIVRLPLVIGKNPPGNLGRMLNAVKKGIYFNVAGGKAKRSLVWIDDIFPFIKLLATKGGIYNLTDGCDTCFAELYGALCDILHKRKNPSLPRMVALTLAKIGDSIEWLTGRKMPYNSSSFRKMTSDLTFSCHKAIKDFGWQPTTAIAQIGTIFREDVY